MARQMSSEEYQELGRSYYKLKQYQKAVEIFTQGIEASPTASLYDHRAATFDKLEDFNAAVKDGREIIKLNKKDVKGYLRTANVLEKMEKPETALGIFKYGMKNVPVGDKNFKLLQQLHDKLTRKLSPAVSIDPFTILPVELAEMILGYLSFRHMVSCMRVSRGWRDYLSKLPKLWMHLDLSGARRPVPRSFVNVAVQRSKSRLTRVTIHRFDHMDMVKNIAKACKDLQHLEFISLPYTMSASLIEIARNALNLQNLTVHPEILLDTVTELLNNRPTLHHVTLSQVKYSKYTAQWQEDSYPNLKTLTMHFTSPVVGSQVNLQVLLSLTPKLEYLSLANIDSTNHLSRVWPAEMSLMPPLTTLILKHLQGSELPYLPPTLQQLELEHDGNVSFARTRPLLTLHALPNLTHLSLAGFSDLSSGALSEFLDDYLDEDGRHLHKVQEAKPLHSLKIHKVITHDALFRGSNSFLGTSPRILTPSLYILDIATLPVDDDEIEAMLTGYHTEGLKSIDLTDTSVTGASVKMLADGLPLLERIRVDGCTRIRGRDAIDYAERKGIAVSCQISEHRGSRKVRYG